MLAGASPFRRLVYPLAVAGGLGVHVTLDLGGQARFGPDVSWIDGVDYAFDETRAAAFYAAIRRYWPGLPDGALQPGYTGIRPKLGPAGQPAADFVIQGPGRARRSRPGQPLRDRVAGPDRVAGDRGLRVAGARDVITL